MVEIEAKVGITKAIRPGGNLNRHLTNDVKQDIAKHYRIFY
jgi:hypothetical protein